MHAGLTDGISIGSNGGSAFASPSRKIKARIAPATNNRLTIGLGERDRVVGRQVRSVFFVGLIPCAFSQALCSACAFVSAAVLGRLAGLPFGVNILITRDIGLAPADKLTRSTKLRSGCRACRNSVASRAIAAIWLLSRGW
jgi:hypothetical protein